MRAFRITRLAAVAAFLAAAACAGPDADEGDDAAAVDTAATADSGAVADADANGALVNPETATEAELAGLPGMTAEAAAALVAGRPYETMLEVDEVLEGHLDAEGREDLYRRMFKPLDLNSASSEEIQLIPGVGDRMTHEFEEYRPYDDIARFRREIGKYVDEAEVARLERYVTIR